jgi:hypothetical protein
MDDVRHVDLSALFPCGHRCVCGTCAGALMAKPAAARECPLCSVAVLGAMRVFDV